MVSVANGVRNMSVEYWGYHLVLDIGGCNKESITNPEHIANFSRELVKRIDMIPYGEPQVVHFGEDDDHSAKAGYTLVQLISTSNIMAHFCDSTGECYMDIFSCRTFDKNDAIAVVEEFFAPTNIRDTFILRKAFP